VDDVNAEEDVEAELVEVDDREFDEDELIVVDMTADEEEDVTTARPAQYLTSIAATNVSPMPVKSASLPSLN
jgi:hypothetical protein